MSTLWIEEWQQIRTDTQGHPVDVPSVNLGRTQLTYTSTSVRTSFPFDPTATFIIVRADVDSYIELGSSSVVADQTGFILPSGVFRTFAVGNGITHVAIIQKT